MKKKVCRKCLLEKEENSFYKDKQKSDGLSSYCKSCKSLLDKEWVYSKQERVESRKQRSKSWREENQEQYKASLKEWKNNNLDKKRELDKKSSLWTLYRLTVEQYVEMLESQDKKCYICNKASVKLVIDHDHRCCPGRKSCGKCVRSLLCYKCNTMIGFMETNIDILGKALHYSGVTSENLFKED